MSTVISIQNFIGGRYVPCTKTIPSYNPSTGKVLVEVPDSDASDVEAAVAAAKAAFPEWSSKPITERSRLLNKVADVLESKLDEFALAESQDQGKPYWLTKTMDIPRAVLNFRHFANSCLCDSDKCFYQPSDSIFNYTVHSPVGVAGIIVPWNLPLHLLSFKLAPALVYGNTVVAKPSEFTSLTAYKLCEVLQEAGIPGGVVNMVFGYGHKAGEALIKHPDVPLMSFTGSDKTGCHIAEVTGKMAKKLSLEMGGKNAAIVFNDADMKKCAETLKSASFLNQGQICLCTSRIYIQRDIFPSFVQMFVELVKKLKVGNPLKEDTYIGPLCSEQHYAKVKSYLKLAKEEGATFLYGEDQNIDLPEEIKNGYYVAPVVLTDLPDSSRCMQEEIFGPVTCLVPFDTDEEVVNKANGVKYGLCASLWSRDIHRIHSIAPRLEVGTVWCNCWLIRNLHMPFGGTKLSGIGREGTEDSRDFYTTKKTVCVLY